MDIVTSENVGRLSGELRWPEASCCALGRLSDVYKIWYAIIYIWKKQDIVKKQFHEFLMLRSYSI